MPDNCSLAKKLANFCNRSQMTLKRKAKLVFLLKSERILLSLAVIQTHNPPHNGFWPPSSSPCFILMRLTFPRAQLWENRSSPTVRDTKWSSSSSSPKVEKWADDDVNVFQGENASNARSRGRNLTKDVCSSSTLRLVGSGNANVQSAW